MPIRDNGMGLETLQDGKWVPVIPERASMGIDGRRIFDYDQKTGILKFNGKMLPEGALEMMAAEFQSKSTSEQGAEVTFLNPMTGEITLTGVRSIQALTQEEEKYDTTPRYRGTRTFLQRVRDYFRNF